MFPEVGNLLRMPIVQQWKVTQEGQDGEMALVRPDPVWSLGGEGDQTVRDVLQTKMQL